MVKLSFNVLFKLIGGIGLISFALFAMLLVLKVYAEKKILLAVFNLKVRNIILALFIGSVLLFLLWTVSLKMSAKKDITLILSSLESSVRLMVRNSFYDQEHNGMTTENIVVEDAELISKLEDVLAKVRYELVSPLGHPATENFIEIRIIRKNQKKNQTDSFGIVGSNLLLISSKTSNHKLRQYISSDEKLLSNVRDAIGVRGTDRKN